MDLASPVSRSTEPSRLGWRALVTRPRAEAAALAEALAARGVDAVIEPLLDIRFRDEPAPDLSDVQAVLCTSANGVRALARLSTDRDVPLFAIGDATAGRAAVEGFRTVASAGGNLEELAALIAQRLRPQRGRLLHVSGRAVAGDLAGRLRQCGFTVDRAVLYEALPPPALTAATLRALEAGFIDFVLLFSPRTAAIFVRLVEQAGVTESMRRVTALSISAAADHALSALRFRERRVAARPDQPALLAALDGVIAERRQA